MDVTAQKTRNGRRPLRVMLMMGGRFDNAAAGYAVKLGHVLSQQGHSVLFLGKPNSPAVQRASSSAITRVEALELNSSNPVVLMRSVRAFRRIIAEFKPDIINTLKSNDHNFAVLFAPLQRPPIVRTRCEPRAPAKHFVNRFLHRQATACIACARFIRENHFIRIGVEPGNIAVIRPGIDVDEFRNNAPTKQAAREQLGLDDAVWIGLVARFTQVKAHELALRAFAKVIQHRVPEAKLLFTGVEYDVRIEELQQLASELGISEKVHFIRGKVDDVRVALRALDVLIVPSLASESIARIAMEALALGVPTVGSGVNSVPEVIGDAGLIVPANEPIALGDGVVKMLSEKEIQERAERLGPERMRRMYSPEQFRTLTEDLYYRFAAVSGSEP